MKFRIPTPYKEARAASYPSIGDQLDALVKFADHLREAGQQLPPDVEKWVDDCKGVKEKFPKSE